MAAYPKPSGNTGTFNNSSFNNAGNTGGLTIADGLKYFVSYPTTQSPSTITANNFVTTGSLNVAGTSQFGGDAIFIGGATITGPLTFADNVEVQGTTTLDDTLLCLTTANIDGELTCNGGILMTPQSPSTNSIIDFVNAGGECQLYLDPTTAYDIVFQSSQSEGTAGLTVVNATSSFTMQCATIAPSIVGMQMKNPINMANFGLYGIQNIFINSNTTTPFITLSASTMNMNQNNITGVGSLSFDDDFTQMTATNVVLNDQDNTFNSTSVQSFNGAVYIINNAPSGYSPILTFQNNLLASNMYQFNNQLVFNNYCPLANNASFNFRLYNSSLVLTSVFNIDVTQTDLFSDLSMNDKNILGLNNLSVTSGQTLSIVDGSTNIMTFNTSGINSYESITMNASNLIMNTNNISGIGILSGTGAGDISISSGLNFTNASGINCGGGSIINCNAITDVTGQLVTTTTPTNNNVTTAIATTGYVNTFGTTVVNPISSIVGATFSPTNAYVYTGSNFVQVNIQSLVVYCNANTPYLTIIFANNLYTPTSRSRITLSAVGYFANTSNKTLLSFTPNSTDTSFNSISIFSTSLSNGQTYATGLQFTFYF